MAEQVGLSSLNDALKLDSVGWALSISSMRAQAAQGHTASQGGSSNMGSAAAGQPGTAWAGRRRLTSA